jgi:hypothetical protein
VEAHNGISRTTKSWSVRLTLEQEGPPPKLVACLMRNRDRERRAQPHASQHSMITSILYAFTTLVLAATVLISVIQRGDKTDRQRHRLVRRFLFAVGQALITVGKE